MFKSVGYITTKFKTPALLLDHQPTPQALPTQISVASQNFTNPLSQEATQLIACIPQLAPEEMTHCTPSNHKLAQVRSQKKLNNKRSLVMPYPANC